MYQPISCFLSGILLSFSINLHNCELKIGGSGFVEKPLVYGLLKILFSYSGEGIEDELRQRKKRAF